MTLLPPLFIECHLCGRRSYKARSRHGCMLGAETRMVVAGFSETVEWTNPIDNHQYRWITTAGAVEA